MKSFASVVALRKAGGDGEKPVTRIGKREKDCMYLKSTSNDSVLCICWVHCQQVWTHEYKGKGKIEG